MTKPYIEVVVVEHQYGYNLCRAFELPKAAYLL